MKYDTLSQDPLTNTLAVFTWATGTVSQQLLPIWFDRPQNGEFLLRKKYIFLVFFYV